MKILLFVNKYFKSKVKLVIYVFLAIGVGSLPIFARYILGYLIDNINECSDITKIYSLIFYFASITILILIIKVYKGILYAKLQTSVAFCINKEILEHVKRLPMDFFSGKDTVFLNQRINNDVNNIVIFFINIISDSITNFSIVLCIIAIFFNVKKHIVIIFILIVIMYILLYIFMKKKLYDLNYRLQISQSKFFSQLNEQIANIKFIKVHVLFEHLKNKLEKTFDIVLTNVLKSVKCSILFNSIESLITLTGQITFIIFIAAETIKGEITIGMFSILLTYFFNLIDSLQYFIGLGEQYQEKLGAYDRIIQIINTEKEHNGDIVLKNCKKISVNNLSFSYNNEKILDDISVEFNKGNIYCITGENGSGKSTLVDILIGIHSLKYEGEVTYDDIPIDKLNMYEIRKKWIGIVEQTPELLDESVDENLDAVNKDYSDEMLEYLLNSFELKYVYNKNRGETCNLSGGEKQKVAIIRALLKNPSVLIFDEPTSALDKESILEFKNIVQGLSKEKIIIIVTHDSNLIRMLHECIEIKI